MAHSPLPTSPLGEEPGKPGISGAAGAPSTPATASTPATVPTATPASTGVELSASVRQTAPSPSVLLILNGTDKPQTFHADRYRELWPSATTGSTHTTTPDSTPTATITAREVTSGRHYDITKDIKLSPRQTLILEF